MIDQVRRSTERSHRYTSLHTCSLVSKKWTVCSRAHLFRKVKIQVREGRPALTPPTFILPYIEKLDISTSQIFPSEDLLQAFSTAPIEHLKITGGVLADERDYIQELFAVHSSMLRLLEFDSCLFSPYNIIVMVGRRCP